MSLTDMSTPSSRAKQSKEEKWYREQIKRCQMPQEDRAADCTGLYFFYKEANGVCPLCRLHKKRKHDKEIQDRYEQRTRDMERRNRQETLAAQQLNAFLDDIYPVAQSVLKDD